MVNTNQFQSAVNAAFGEDRDKIYWDNVRKASAVLEKVSSGDLDKLFETLSSQQNFEAGPLVFVLAGKLKHPPKNERDVERFINQFQTVAVAVSPDELDYINDKFTTIMLQFSDYLLENDMTLSGLRTFHDSLRSATSRNGGVLTDLHSRFFCMCLTAKRFDLAIPFLDLDAGSCFLNVQSAHRVKCENALLYFYYGGLIKLALRDFNGAALMFESCVCMPAFAVSSIMLEAMKKLILLNLILGRPQVLPSYRASQMQRVSQLKCQKYHSLVQVYHDVVYNKSNNSNYLVSRLARQIEKVSTELEKDNNLGLADELYLSAVRTNISKLPDVFSKLQISKVKKYCRIDDERICIQHELESFLQRDDILGKIDAREGTISFETVERSKDVDQQQLENATNCCSSLDELLRHSQMVLDAHPAMIARQSKSKHHVT